jgi:hypothetical protein
MVAKKIYTSARGKPVDMFKLMKQNEMAIAVGNAKVNARGDKLGPGGVIIKKREEIVSDVPDQLNVRPQVPAPAPVATPAPAPVVAKKDVANQDPLGEE